MTNVVTHLHDIRFNPAESAFETSAVVDDNGTSYTYPIRLVAPIDASTNAVARAMIKRAERLHEMGTSDLRSTAPIEDTPLSELHGDGFLHRLLGSFEHIFHKNAA